MANGKDEKLARVTVSVVSDDYASFELLGRASGVSTAWLVRRAMREFLDRYEKGGVLELSLKTGRESVEKSTKSDRELEEESKRCLV